MKSIFLIIDSDFPHSENYSRCREVWKKYMNSNKDIRSFFIRFNPSLQEEIKVEDNVMYFKGEESFAPGILDKTLRAMNYCLQNFEFDFIVRTNLSSFWDFNNYNKYVESLPQERTANGIIGNFNNTLFLSGSGFIVSKDIVKYMVENLDINDSKDVYDDVGIGLFFKKNNIHLTLGKRKDIEMTSLSELDKTIRDAKGEHYHYRVKTDMGSYDKCVTEKLLSLYYNV